MCVQCVSAGLPAVDRDGEGTAQVERGLGACIRRLEGGSAHSDGIEQTRLDLEGRWYRTGQLAGQGRQGQAVCCLGANSCILGLDGMDWRQGAAVDSGPAAAQLRPGCTAAAIAAPPPR